MSDTYSYDEAVARNAEQGLAATLAHLESTLTDLSGFVTKVCANWEGDEKEIFQGIQTRWDHAAGEVRNILGQIKGGLGQTTTSVGDMRGRVRSALQS